MTTEAGAVGGVLAGGSSFGSSANAHSIIDQNLMFDFYHGGGLDLTCLGMAEVRRGRQRQHLAVRRPPQRLRRVHRYFAERPRRRVRRHVHRRRARRSRSTTASSGSSRRAGRGSSSSTSSRSRSPASIAAPKSQPVIYVTERCVFQLTTEGLELIEVAPGIDIDRDILAHMDFKPIINKPLPMDCAHLPRRADGADGRSAEPEAARARQLRRRPQHPVRQSRRLERPQEERHRRPAEGAGGGVQEGRTARQFGGQSRRLPHRRGSLRRLCRHDRST